jgi:hypothetical protein
MSVICEDLSIKHILTSNLKLEELFSQDDPNKVTSFLKHFRHLELKPLIILTFEPWLKEL